LRNNFTFEGLAYHFYPPFNFSNETELIFYETEGEPYHLDDSLLGYCSYNVLNYAEKNITSLGGEIIINNSVEQIFPSGAVLNQTRFGIEVINITLCNHCLNFMMDVDETGVDCGGSCGACEENCYDRIQNQDETGIDCGGVCFSIDSNETNTCGFDFNKDCNFTPCEKILCTSDLNCSCDLYSKDIGYCIKGDCVCHVYTEDVPIVMQLWKNQTIDLSETLKLIKRWTLY
jgi:hypothetical protein